MRSSACDTLSRSCARRVLCWLAFPSASALGSTGSAASCPALFVGFPATMAESDFSRPCIIGYGSSPSRCGPAAIAERSIARPPGSRAKSVCTCQVLRPRRVERALAMMRLFVLPSALETASAPGLFGQDERIAHQDANPCLRYFQYGLLNSMRGAFSDSH